MIDDELKKELRLRIATMKSDLETFVLNVNKEIAFRNGRIQMLEELLNPPSPKPNEVKEGDVVPVSSGE